MSHPPVLNIHIDGAARGNPGPAAYAFVIARSGEPDIEEKGCLGSVTNNQAEYTALVRVLEKARELGADRLLIHSDSELLVKQMNGEYRVKNETLRELYQQAKELTGLFHLVTLQHVPRSQNSRADALCNEALDGKSSRPASGVKPKSEAVRKRAAAPTLAAIQEEALECLRSAAACWSGGNPNFPRPEQVWEQLWSILEEHGVVK